MDVKGTSDIAHDRKLLLYQLSIFLIKLQPIINFLDKAATNYQFFDKAATNFFFPFAVFYFMDSVAKRYHNICQ